MKIPVFLLLLFLAVGFHPALAGEKISFTTLSGKSYVDAEVTRTEPDGITVMYDSGADKILFRSLPEDIRRKYHYNPQAAEAYHAQELAQDKERERQKRIDAVNAAMDARLKESALTVQLQVKRPVTGGALCAFTITETYEEEYQVLRNSLANCVLTEKEYETRKRTLQRQIQLPDTYMVVGLPSNNPGATWSGMVYECGSYSFIPMRGAMHTVYRYATRLELARILSRDVAD
jgi:hypothetical protein